MRIHYRPLIAMVMLALAACAAHEPPPPPAKPVAQNREQPVTAVVPPLGAVCRLQVERHHPLSNAGYFSSGAYIGDGLVVTAAHNLYSNFTSKVKSVAVECGVMDHRDGAGQIGGVRPELIAIWPGYHFEDYGDDTAILRVRDRPATAFEVAPDDLVLEKDEDVYLAGFPGSGYGEGKHMFSARGKVLRVDAAFIEYGIVTATGNSGGPVWVERDGRIVLVGVHVSGAQSFGTARRVSASRVAQLKGMLAPG